ncbi:hypothetical protein D770_25390 [Flammeovirgaceae bacterium 311]|nr:hypothetical protein D770_25390 [Flammeovirgaceae bacterium 311]
MEISSITLNSFQMRSLGSLSRTTNHIDACIDATGAVVAAIFCAGMARMQEFNARPSDGFRLSED